MKLHHKTKYKYLPCNTSFMYCGTKFRKVTEEVAWLEVEDHFLSDKNNNLTNFHFMPDNDVLYIVS